MRPPLAPVKWHEIKVVIYSVKEGMSIKFLQKFVWWIREGIRRTLQVLDEIDQVAITNVIDIAHKFILHTHLTALGFFYEIKPVCSTDPVQTVLMDPKALTWYCLV